MGNRKKQKPDLPNPLEDSDTFCVIACAIRYSLGRKTYMLGLVIDWCKRYWSQFSDERRKEIRSDLFREIQSAEKFSDQSFLLSYEGRTWCQFLEWIDNFESSGVLNEDSRKSNI